MTGVLFVPEAQQGNITKKVTNTMVEMTGYTTAGDYTLFKSGNVTLSNAASVVVKSCVGRCYESDCEEQDLSRRFLGDGCSLFSTRGGPFVV